MTGNPTSHAHTKWMGLIEKSRRGTANGKRHPHQPAVLLWFVSAAGADMPRMINWVDGKALWKVAITSHGGSGSPESPITALVNAEILSCSSKLARTASSPPARKVLDSQNPLIGLPEEIWNLVVANPTTKTQVCDFLKSQLD
jgi:hypothetical protein